MKCPVCRATVRPANRSEAAGTPDSQSCRRCGADLTRLIQLHDRAVQHYRQAIAAMQAGDYPAAQSQIQQALTLHSTQPDFHALAGQLWALQGNFPQAIASWKQAQHLDSTQAAAKRGLQLITQLSEAMTE